MGSVVFRGRGFFFFFLYKFHFFFQMKVLCGVFPGESAKDELKKQIYGAGLTHVSVSYSQFFKTMITFCRILKI